MKGQQRCYMSEGGSRAFAIQVIFGTYFGITMPCLTVMVKYSNHNLIRAW